MVLAYVIQHAIYHVIYVYTNVIHVAIEHVTTLCYITLFYNIVL